MSWRCPVCRHALEFTRRSATCIQNHHFDRAKEGYTNLLLSNQKQSLLPGDNREMIKARHAFLRAGYYEPLADLLANKLTESASHRRADVSLLDCGCGDGYYTSHATNRLANEHQVTTSGIDISKDALKVAARQHPQITFAVASNFELPLSDQHANLAMLVFAPADPAELKRVLADDGELLIVSPGPMHLWELRSHLYRAPRPHALPASPAGFESIEQQQLEFTISLKTPDDLRNLLTMTPYFWQAKPARRESFLSLDQPHITTDFLVSRYRKQTGVDEGTL